jgi:hypothetical protein
MHLVMISASVDSRLVREFKAGHLVGLDEVKRDAVSPVGSRPMRYKKDCHIG